MRKRDKHDGGLGGASLNALHTSAVMDSAMRGPSFAAGARAGFHGTFNPSNCPVKFCACAHLTARNYSVISAGKNSAEEKRRAAYCGRVSHEGERLLLRERY